MQGYGRPSAYQVTQVSTTNKTKLVLMMYEGAIRFISDAKRCIETKDIAGRGIAINKAQRIIHELRAALNMEKGGEVAVNLEKVYTVVTKRLLNANITGSSAELAVCLDMLSPLKEAWEQVSQKPGFEHMLNSTAANAVAAAAGGSGGVKVAI